MATPASITETLPSSSKGKIVYFDYWTVGINNFATFDSKLKAKGYDTKLIHLNSWRGIREPDYQKIKEIECYDIRHFNTNLIFNVLKSEKPLAVIMLNASFITDRTVILSCKKLGIKVVYLSHGALTREKFKDNTIRSINQAKKKNRLRNSVRHLRSTVFNYLFTIIRYDRRFLFSLYPYQLILNTFFNPARYLIFPPHAFDLEPDLTLVYSHTEATFFKERFANPSSVRVLGIPELDGFFQQFNTLGDDRSSFFHDLSLPLDKPLITYIEEGIVVDEFWDSEYRMDFMRDIASMCKEAGYHLAIKLHPRTAASAERRDFDMLGESVTVLEQANFPKLIYFSDKCISHYSTTFIYPMLLDKPILVPRWGRSSELLSLYTPREVTPVHTKEEFRQYLRQTTFSYDRSEYLNDYVPFRDGKASDRIVNNITETILEA